MLKDYFIYTDSNFSTPPEFTENWTGTAIMKIRDNKGKFQNIRFLLDCNYPVSEIRDDIMKEKKWKNLKNNVNDDTLKLDMKNHTENYRCTLNLKLKDKNSIPSKLKKKMLHKKLREQIALYTMKKKKCLADPEIMKENKKCLKIDGILGSDALKLFQYVNEETNDGLIIDSPLGIIWGNKIKPI